jgi:hypothetical protein
VIDESEKPEINREAREIFRGAENRRMMGHSNALMSLKVVGNLGKGEFIWKVMEVDEGSALEKCEN